MGCAYEEKTGKPSITENDCIGYLRQNEGTYFERVKAIIRECRIGGINVIERSYTCEARDGAVVSKFKYNAGAVKGKPFNIYVFEYTANGMRGSTALQFTKDFNFEDAMVFLKKWEYENGVTRAIAGAGTGKKTCGTKGRR